MKMKSLAMLAMSGFAATSIVYMSSAIADETSAQPQPPVVQTVPADGMQNQSGSMQNDPSQAQNNPGVANMQSDPSQSSNNPGAATMPNDNTTSAPPSNPGNMGTGSSDEGGPDMATGDDDY